MIKTSKELFERAHEVNVIPSIFKDTEFICKSNKSKNEWTVINDHGIFFCNCPDYPKHNPKHCKHTIAAMIYLELGKEIIIEEIKIEGNPQEEKKEPEKKSSFGFGKKEILISFQKALNEYNILKAWYFFQIMSETAEPEFTSYINNYIQKKVSEKLCICDPDLIAGIRAYSNYNNLEVDMIYGLIDIFCSAKKSDDCPRCQERHSKRKEYHENIEKGESPIFKIE